MKKWKQERARCAALAADVQEQFEKSHRVNKASVVQALRVLVHTILGDPLQKANVKGMEAIKRRIQKTFLAPVKRAEK